MIRRPGPGRCKRVGEQLGINPETLRNWVSRPRSTRATGRARRPMTRSGWPSWSGRYRELRRANEILKSASAFFAAELDRPSPLIVAYIDEHKDEFGVEPICRVLTEAGTQIAPSTYYAAKTRPPSARSISDAATTAVIEPKTLGSTITRSWTAPPDRELTTLIVRIRWIKDAWIGETGRYVVRRPGGRRLLSQPEQPGDPLRRRQRARRAGLQLGQHRALPAP